jgi:hypothetical protein
MDSDVKRGSSRKALRANPYFNRQASLLRWEIFALLLTAANAIALTVAGPDVRSNPVVIAWTVGLVATNFILLAKWLPLWRRMWQEQNRIEQRTSSDRASLRLAEILGQRFLPVKVLIIGCAAGLVAAAIAWPTSQTLAIVCGTIAVGASLSLAWSLSR